MGPSRSCTSRWKADEGGGDLEEGGFTNDVVGRTGCRIGGMCSELWSRDIPSVKKVKMSIPLQTQLSPTISGIFLNHDSEHILSL